MLRSLLFTFFSLFVCFSSFAQTTLPTFWTFVNPSPSNDSNAAPNGWKTRLDISVSGSTPYIYSTGSDKTAACRLDGTNEYVRIWFTDKPGQLSYYLKGTGISPNPAFAGSFSVEESIDGISWTTLRNFTSMNAAFTRYTDKPAANSRYVRFFYNLKQSGSNVALDSVFLNSAPANPTPAINIKRGSNSIAPGATYFVGNDTATVFTIENKGIADTLFINKVLYSGTNYADYKANVPAWVAANSSKDFTLSFKAGAPGTRLGTLNIFSNDSNKKQYVINFYGIGGKLASEPVSQASNLNFTNVKAYALTVNFTPPTATPEKFLVLRTSDKTVTSAPVDGVTYSKGDKIGNAQVAYIGTGNSFSPTYILASSVYTFSVYPFNGPAGFENYLTSSSLQAVVGTKGKNYGSYYSGLNIQSPDFLTNLSKLINRHDTLFYSNYSTNLIDKFLARDTAGGKKYVSCVYTGLSTPYNDPFVWWGNGPSATLTREHTYAQSWMPSNNGGSWPNSSNGKEMPEYNDLHHLFPSDQANANVRRSNNPFGEVVGTPTFVSPTGEGKLGKDKNGVTVWEPTNSHKGDLARALFYMCVAYNGVDGNNWKLPSNQDEAILKKWHMQDPPDALEIARHELIYSLQKNRNPFIDSVVFADRINFSNMTYIKDTTISTGKKLNQVKPNIYPNPSVDGLFNISIGSAENMRVYNTLGKLILYFDKQNMPAKLDLRNFPSGVYVVEIDNYGFTRLIKE